MSVKEVIKQVAILLQLNDLLDANLDDYQSLDEQLKKDINVVLSCINEVLCDISTDHLLLEHTEQIEILNQTFDLANLTKVFYKLVNFDGACKIKQNSIVASNGIHTITYNYLPELVDLNSNINHDSRLTLYGLCYGVAKEYCLVCGNYAESEMWESKFENAMQIAVKKSGGVYLKPRRWF